MAGRHIIVIDEFSVIDHDASSQLGWVPAMDDDDDDSWEDGLDNVNNVAVSGDAGSQAKQNKSESPASAQFRARMNAHHAKYQAEVAAKMHAEHSRAKAEREAQQKASAKKSKRGSGIHSTFH